MLGFPTGVQDYYPAIYGGALQLHYRPGETRMERLPVDLEALERRLMLVYSGQPHASAPSNWRLYRRRIEGDPTARDGFEAIARAAVAAGEALRQGDWRALGRAMTADWKARQGIDPYAGAARSAASRASRFGGRSSGGEGLRRCVRRMHVVLAARSSGSADRYRGRRGSRRPGAPGTNRPERAARPARRGRDE